MVNIEHRRALTKLRISDHILQIERGRYSKNYVSPEQRKCPYCHVMENEEHFLVNCSLYSTERNLLFQKLNKTIYNFQDLISPQNNKRTIAKYIYDCFAM